MKERYLNSRNGRIAVIARRDEEARALDLMYEDGNGGTRVSMPTFKKNWKRVDDAPVEDETAIVMQQKKDLGIECPPIDSYEVVEQSDSCSDGTSYKQVMKEIAADGKKAAKRLKSAKAAAKKSNERGDSVETRMEAIKRVLDATKGVSYRTRANAPATLVVLYGEETFFEVRSTKQGATFNCRTVDVPDSVDDVKYYKYYRPAAIKTTSNYIDVLNDILTKKIKEDK